MPGKANTRDFTCENCHSPHFRFPASAPPKLSGGHLIDNHSLKALRQARRPASTWFGLALKKTFSKPSG